MMVFLNYKIKDEKVLKDAQAEGLEPLLPSGLTVKYIGTDNEVPTGNRE